MNKANITWGVLLVIGCCMVAVAEQDEPTRDRNRQGAPGRRTRDTEQRVQRREAAEAYIERWLEQLQERDPDLHAQLVELRENEPWAFRLALRGRWQERRMEQQLKEAVPAFYAAWQDLNEEERRAVRDILGRRDFGDEDGAQDRRERRRTERRPEAHTRTRQWINEWRQAESDQERMVVREALRSHLREEFERRAVRQEEEIERTEQMLRQLRTTLETERARRDERIERVLNRWLAPAE